MAMLLKIGGTFAISIAATLLIASLCLQLAIRYLYRHSLRFGSSLKICALAFFTTLLFTVPLSLIFTNPVHPNHWMTVFNSCLGFLIQAYIFSRGINIPGRPAFTYLQALRITLVQVVFLLGILLIIALVVGLLLLLFPLVKAVFSPS